MIQQEEHKMLWNGAKIGLIRYMEEQGFDPNRLSDLYYIDIVKVVEKITGENLYYTDVFFNKYLFEHIDEIKCGGSRKYIQLVELAYKDGYRHPKIKDQISCPFMLFHIIKSDIDSDKEIIRFNKNLWSGTEEHPVGVRNIFDFENHISQLNRKVEYKENQHILDLMRNITSKLKI